MQPSIYMRSSQALYILLASMVVVLFNACSCSDTEDVIQIPDSMDFFKEAVTNSASVTYTNEEREISFSINSEYNTPSFRQNGKTVTMENLEIILNHGSPSIYNFVLIGTAQFVQGSDHVEPIISIRSMVGKSGSGSEFIPLFDEGEDPFSRVKFFSQKEIAGKLFNEVYAFEYEDGRPYSKLYITPEEGVAAFADEHNELWVFDRFRN